MKKALYTLIILVISIPAMTYGIKVEQDSLLVNGVAVLEIIVPVFTFLLTQLFILLFDKEDKPIIILASSFMISVLGDLITIGYYNIDLSSLRVGQGTLALVFSALITMMLSLISLRLYTSADAFFSHHPKQKN